MKYGYKDVEESIRCAESQYDMENTDLPPLGENAEEEESEGNLEECSGEDIEDFTKLDVLPMD